MITLDGFLSTVFFTLTMVAVILGMILLHKHNKLK